MKRYKIPSPRFPQYHAQVTDIQLLLAEQGVKIINGNKWPDEGVQAHFLAGLECTTKEPVSIMTWVAPKPKTEKKSSAHRVYCHCPGCGKVLSAGRLHQHLCKRNKEAS